VLSNARRKPTATALLSFVAACGGAAAVPEQISPTSPKYVAPTDQTIVAEEDPSYDGHALYILNNSSASIVVTSVHVYDCENIASPCTLIRLQIPIGPGQRKRVAMIRPSDPERSYSYKYRWTWSGGR